MPALTTAGIYPGTSNVMAAHIIATVKGEYDEEGRHRCALDRGRRKEGGGERDAAAQRRLGVEKRAPVVLTPDACACAENAGRALSQQQRHQQTNVINAINQHRQRAAARRGGRGARAAAVLVLHGRLGCAHY